MVARIERAVGGVERPSVASTAPVNELEAESREQRQALLWILDPSRGAEGNA